MHFFKQIFNLFLILNLLFIHTGFASTDTTEKKTFINPETEQVDPIDTLNSAIANLASLIDKSNRLKITGYIQPQFQLTETEGAESFAGGNFAAFQDNRFQMRRGRVKFTYEHGLAMYMLNTDWTEKGVNIRETYVRVTDPWTEHFQLTLGMRQYLFGHDPNYSSGDRETPERARMFQILFPTERDLQAIITFQPPKTSRYNWMRLDVAAANGSGVAAEFDKYKDIYGRASISKSNESETIKLGFGVSYLKGGYRSGVMKLNSISLDANNNPVYVTSNDSANLTSRVPREYIGADLQLTTDTKFGINLIRAEYIQGWQTGTASSNTTPNVLPTADLFKRRFNGFSFYFIQNIGQSKFQLVAKYDWYDPNVQVSGTQIGAANSKTTAADIKYSTIGLGINYRIMEGVKITAYYDIVSNEITALKGYDVDRKDNVFTFRIQYKF